MNVHRRIAVVSLTLFTGSTVANWALADETSPSAAGTEVLEEILVTAQKRSERIRDVPIGITAVTADDVDKAGASTTMELTDLVPRIDDGARGQLHRARLRGISTLVTGVADEPNVATCMERRTRPHSILTSRA
jgi:iron complex outermembrane recepter protein